jgi:hypothetical protein
MAFWGGEAHAPGSAPSAKPKSRADRRAIDGPVCYFFAGRQIGGFTKRCRLNLGLIGISHICASRHRPSPGTFARRGGSLRSRLAF